MNARYDFCHQFILYFDMFKSLHTYLFFSFALVFIKANGYANTANTPDPDSLAMGLKEVVITENRLTNTYAKQNRNIRIVDQQQIKSLPARSLNELLGHVAGVDLRQRGPFGLQADISIDGGSFEQTLILVDGVKMLDAQTAHHGLNLPIPLEAIERIEIIRGPAARIYGINSLTGAINIVTKNNPGSAISIRTFAGSSFRTDTSSAKNKLFYNNGLQASLALPTKRAGHHGISVGRASGNGHRYNTAFRQHQVFYKGNIPVNGADALTLMGGYVSSDFGANGFYAAPGDKESQEIVKTGFAAVGYRMKLSDRFSVTPRLSYRHTKDDYRYFRHDLGRARSRHSGYSLTPEVNASWQTGLGDLGLGLEMRQERIHSSNIGDHQRNNYGGYAEFKTDFHELLSVNAGTYLNYNSDYGWQVFPGIDLGLRLTENLKWTAHTGTGQRIPSFTDLYLDQRPGNIGNPLIRPEEAWHMETGLKYSDRRIYAQANYFYRNINNFIDWVHPAGGTPPYQPLNFDHNRVHGLSVSADYWLSSPDRTGQWRTGLQYTYLRPSYSLGEAGNYQSKYSTEILRQQLTGQIFFRHQEFSMTATARFQERLSYKSYVLADLRVARQINQFEAYLDVQNILDIDYIEAAAVPMPGRWVSLGLNYQLTGFH